MRRNRRDAYLDFALQPQSQWAGQDHGRVHGRPRVGTGPDRQPRPAYAPAIPPPRRPALEPDRRFGRAQRGKLSAGGGSGWHAYRLPSAHHRRLRHTGKTQSVGACHRSLLFRLDRSVVWCAARGKPQLPLPGAGVAQHRTQLSAQPSRPQRRQKPAANSRLRRPALHLAGLFCLEGRPANRLPRLRAWLGQSPTALWRGHRQDRIHPWHQLAGQLQECQQAVGGCRPFGSARTGLEDESTDLYPIPLSRETLWPGTVYADPYGHVLVLVEWVPQTAERPGILLAVDAQPDNSVTRKRFWEGTFLFANVTSAGPGFKAFRPLAHTASGGLRALSNDELADNPGFTPFSLEQDQLSPDDFYARLAKLSNPGGLDPKQAYEATLDALVEQIETRVTSVDNGEAYFRKSPGSVIPMPSGAAIFQTIGPWEDYSTPSRDMRLIIAINVLNGLPEKIVRHPELFVMNGKSPEEAKAEIEQYHARRIQERSIRYTRTDGSPWELSVAEVLARKPAYEMTYNPNDCAELRWGAKPDTEEYSTCRRHAPAEQHAKMERYRIWFREARRPTQ